MINKYEKVLNHNKEFNFYKSATQYSTSQYNVNNHIDKHLFDINSNVFAPVLFSFIWWVIFQAQKQNIKTLYFLARDGYILYKIALKICKNCNININCKYLYCSRFSLRTPTYNFIGNEAYDLIFGGGYQLTLKDVLSRLYINHEKRDKIYKLENITIDENELLSKSTYAKLVSKLKNNDILNEHIQNISKKSYDITIQYLKQEGLFNLDTVAIVDTGWTGSIQRSLRQLLNSANAKPNIIGYYFGMYVKSKSPLDGIYNTFYFNSNSSLFLINKFNNNLFESICAAPHPMTIGYEKRENKIVPIFAQDINNYKSCDILPIQLNIIESFADYSSKLISFNDYNFNQHHKLCKKLLQGIMFKPSKQDVQSLCKLKFCDNIVETYYKSIINSTSKNKLSSYLLVKRIYNKILNNKVQFDSYPDLFWPYGSLELSNIKAKWFYRINILFGDIIRNYIIKIK